MEKSDLASIFHVNFFHNLRDRSGSWSVEFFFGDSKRIHSITLDEALNAEIEKIASSDIVAKGLQKASAKVAKLTKSFSHANLQSVWIGKADGDHPHEIVDALGDIALDTINGISKFEFEDRVERLITDRLPKRSAFNGKQKILRYASEVFAGLYVGSLFNAAVADK